MSMFYLVILCSCFAAISCARTEYQIKSWFITHAMDCNNESPVSAEDLLKMEKHQIPETKNAKCLIACVFRKANWMDAKGMFAHDNAVAFAVEEYPDNPTKLENSKKLFDQCKSVNDETVSDGESGCDRAFLLTKCLIGNAPKMGFVLQ